MEDYDPEFFKSLQYLQNLNLDENPVDFYFAIEENVFGRLVMKDLKENGRNIKVDESNKEEYIKLICQMKMSDSVRE